MKRVLKIDLDRLPTDRLLEWTQRLATTKERLGFLCDLIPLELQACRAWATPHGVHILLVLEGAENTLKETDRVFYQIFLCSDAYREGFNWLRVSVLDRLKGWNCFNQVKHLHRLPDLEAYLLGEGPLVVAVE